VSNHGPGTSFYYRDPDGNKVELSSLNFSSRAEIRAFMATENSRTTPIGFPLDPERLAAGAEAGRNLKRIDLGAMILTSAPGATGTIATPSTTS